MSAALNERTVASAAPAPGRRWAGALAVLLAMVLSGFAASSAAAQSIPAPITVDFDGLGYSAADPPRAVEDVGNIRFTSSVGDIEPDVNSGEGGTDGLLLDAFSAGETLTVETIDGREFDFQEFWHNGFSFGEIVSAEGFKDGVSVGAQTTGLGGTGVGTITLTSTFNDVDRVVLTSGVNGFFSVFDSFEFGVAIPAADTTPPAVSSISRVGTPAANVSSVTYTVTFDEPANNITTDDFSVTTVTGTATGNVASVSASSGTSVTVTVDTLAGTGSIRLDLNAGTDIIDDSGNGNGTNGAVAAFAGGDTHAVDRDAPSAPSTPDMTAATDSGVSDADDITNDATPTFEGTAEANATVTLLSSVDGAVGSTTANGSGDWSITASTLAEGAHTLTATAEDAAGNVSGASGGLAITVDTTAPVFQSIARQTPSGQTTNADSLVFRASFDGDVVNLDGADFTVTGTSATVTGVSAVTGGSVFDLTVSGGDLAGYDGAVGIDLAGGQNITDAAGNAVATSEPATDQTYTLDNTAPVFTSIARQTPAAATTNADTLVFRATFDGDVANVTTGDFAVTGTSATVTNVATVTPDTMFDLTVSGGDLAGFTGTVGIDLAGGQDVTDAAGNALPGTEPATDETYTLDNTAPAGYTASLDQDPVTAGDVGAVSFTFAGAEIGADYSFTISSSAGGGPVSNTGTIATASDQITGLNLAALNDGVLTLSVTLTDPAGNTGAPATDTAVKDAAGPRLNTISRQAPTTETTNADAPVFRVVFNEAMTPSSVEPADFAVTGAGAGGAALAVAPVAVTGDTTFDVTVSGVASNDGALDLALAGSATLTDAGGNALTNTAALGAVEGYILDNTAPAATGIALVGGPGPGAASVTFRVSFNEDVTSVAAGDFTLTAAGGAAGDIASVSGAPGGDIDVVVDTITGAGTLRLDLDAGSGITDLAGNGPPAGFTTGAVHTVDRTAPEVSTIAVQGTPAPTAASVVFDVTFSEAVDNVSADDFTLTATGGAAGTIAPFGPVSGTTIPVTVNTISGQGALRLDLNGGTDIEDADDNGPPAAFTGGGVHTVDLVDPTIVSFERAGGAAQATTASTLSWTVTFSEPVAGVDAADFQLTASTAALAVTGTGATRTVTASGGDLASFTGDVGLDVAAGAAFTDDPAGNAGVIAEPGVDEIYTRSNPSNRDRTAPVLEAFARQTPAEAETDADTLVFAVTFSESVRNVGADDFLVTGTTATAVVDGDARAYTVTVSGGDLADLDGVVGLDLSPDQDIEDRAGNALEPGEPAVDETYTLVNNAGPPTLVSILRQTPAEALTTADTLVFRVSFSEPVQGVDAADFEPTASSAAASAVAPVSDTLYDVTVSGGDLAGFDGEVGLQRAPGAVIEDADGEPLADAAPGVSETYTLDNSAPLPVLATESGGAVSGPFTLVITFAEPVEGFTLDDLVIEGGTAAALSTGDDAVFTAEVTPDAETLVVSVAAGAARDAAGNESLAAEPLSLRLDLTPPSLTVSTPGPRVTGAFEAVFTFSEPVTGFTLADITVENGAPSGLATADDTVFTATVTPAAPGLVTVALPAGAAADAAGNESLAASAETEAAAEAESIAIEVAPGVQEPGAVAADVVVTNPGSAPLSFTASADQPWLDVDPTSGTIPGLGELTFTVTLTDAVNALAPGDYVGAVTVFVDSPSGAASGRSSAAVQTVLVEIPVTLQLAPRLGAITLVAATPSGASGEAGFTYASDLAAFDGLTLTTSGGQASASAEDVEAGTYTLTQSAPPGWRVDSVSCAGDLDGGSRFDAQAGSAVIDLDAGESLVCTFANVRDEDAVRLATQRAIRGFMVRRADRIVEAAPDLSRRFSELDTTERGAFAADMDGSGRYAMSLAGSLSGLRNAAAADTPQIAGVAQVERAFMEGWDVWFAAELSGVTDNRAGERAESDFGVAQLGVDRRVSDTLILGVLAQYDWMEDVSGEIFEEAGALTGARVEGEGWMAGPYAVWRIRDALILDALAMYGRSDNSVDPLGLYEDDFETGRFMLRANLTGQLAAGPWRVRPQAGLTHYEETQDGYTDSLGIVIPEQTVSLGRFRAGPEFAWRHAGDRGGWLEVSTALTAVWDYQTAELFNEAGVLTGGDDDLRADARLGLSALTPWGALIRLETGLAGIGAEDFEATTGRFEIRIPFGAAGRGAGGARLADGAAGLFDTPCMDVHAGFEASAGARGPCDAPAHGRAH